MALSSKGIDRRGFLKGGVVVSAALASAGLFGCAPSKEKTNDTEDAVGMKAHVAASDEAILGEKGEWRPLNCYEDCGNRCLNLGYVVDGVLVRQKTDDTHEDTDLMPQQRSCPRGHSLRQNVYNADRLLYPMKRKSWQPGGGENSHGELRGRDEWQRISWDEALDLVAGEMNRVYRDYGPRSVVLNGERWWPGINLLNAAGGCIRNDEAISFGAWNFIPSLIGVSTSLGDHPNIKVNNDRHDMQNADYIVLYATNPSWACGNFSSYYYKQAQEAGAKFICVGPSRHVSAAALDADWIPVRPGTDTAFLLGVMYEMLRLDAEEGGIVDWEFLDAYTVGFDLDHMPEDAQTDECISEYVRGAYDGIPKTPEWASEICGTPVELITDFARIMAKTNKTMLLHSYSFSRCNGAENLPQAFITLAAMGGHFGKSGHACGCTFSGGDDAGPTLYQSVDVRTNPSIDNPIEDYCNIEGPSWWESIVNGKYTTTTKSTHVTVFTTEYDGKSGSDADLIYEQATEREFDPRILFAFDTNYLQSRMDLNNGVKAMRKMEMCVTIDIKPTITAMFSDIILPAMTLLECSDNEEDAPYDWPWLTMQTLPRRRDAFFCALPIIQPMGECHSDLWIFRKLAERMGLDADEIFPVTNKMNFFDTIINLQYLDADGETWRNAFSVTEEDAAIYGFDNPPQEGKMPLSEFFQKGAFIVETGEENHRFIGYSDYIADPEANPLPSKSGKFELYCQLKADNINVMGVNDEPIKPYANYIVPVEGYEDSFDDWEAKAKGEYPLQVFTGHYLRRAHTCYDNLTWTQEAFVNPVFMNAGDAAERGIQNGDTVLIRSKHGKTLRHAQLVESIMPGVINLPHGAHSVLDETDPDDIIDRGGNEQILYGPTHSNYWRHLDGYNTLLVEVEKYDGEPIPADYERDPFTLEVQE